MRRIVLAALVSVAGVAAASGLAFALKPFAPALSLGVLYVPAVMAAAAYGMSYSVGVAVASMLTFNFLFLPPVHSFTLRDSENWIALAVYLGVAIVVSQLAARTRRQAQESALLAEIATSLLRRGGVSGQLERIANETAAALHVDRAHIDLDDSTRGDGEHYPLAVEGRRLGTITLEHPRQGGAAARKRLLPALASLLGVAIDRERLAREALEAEALRRSDALKTALLRTVSHDLRSPLMAILTSSSALTRKDLELGPEDRHDLARTILDEAERLDRLVANLLDLSRLQAGAARPEPSLWPIDDLVVQALDDLGESGHRVEVTLPEESPEVRADAHQIERVLVNLIENALKYSPSAEPVRVQVASTPTEILVRVIDHGQGILPAERERIFDAFQRGPNGSIRGAGLGLAIARGFAEANGGRVWAESRAEQGATFVLALPAPAPEAAS